MSDSAAEGTLELQKERCGFLRFSKRNYSVHPEDPFVSGDMIKRFALNGGELLVGRSVKKGGRYNGQQYRFCLDKIQSINGREPGEYVGIKPFNELTVIDPLQRLQFEIPGGPASMRVIDLMSPMGRGQRSLIAAPPRTGKTILLQQMAAGISTNHPDIYMMVLLVDERPEEVTEMRRTVNGEVVASSNDQDVASHIRISRLMIEKAKRMVETGQHVLILLDSLTRLGRAFNAGSRSGRGIMSGGLAVGAMQEPKAVFGSARNIEDGGSLTIIATALIETGSRMDELIFNEFKGTGNMEIMLTRELANLRMWPAMDLNMSGTRKEEFLLGSKTVEKIARIRRQIANQPPINAMQILLDAISKYPTNKEFIDSLPE